jgi:molecular chaperone GrpE
MSLSMDDTGSKKTKKKKKTEILQEQLALCGEAKRELEDRMLRLAAEFDNYKKRTAREFEQLVKRANENLIFHLVEVLDNFERALNSAKSAKDFDAFHQGVELIYQHLRDLLAREGLEPIEAVGKAFDPHQHEAVLQVEDQQHPQETVVNEIQRGYMLGEKLLRPARVVVSKAYEGVVAEDRKKSGKKKKRKKK